MHNCGVQILHLLTSETAQLTIVIVMAEKVPVSLLGDAFQVVNQPSILRQMLFARACLPDSTPKLWEIVAQFSTYKYDSSNTLLPSQVKVLVENLTFIDILTPYSTRYT